MITEKIDLKEFKRKKTSEIKSFNFKPASYKKLKKEKINLSGLVNDFLEKNTIEYLNLEFNEQLTENEERKTSSVKIRKENLKKVSKLNLSYLIEKLINSF